MVCEIFVELKLAFFSLYKKKNGELTQKDSYEIKCGKIKGNCSRPVSECIEMADLKEQVEGRVRKTNQKKKTNDELYIDPEISEVDRSYFSDIFRIHYE
ncbi:hypothetical protein V1478_000249 [Vespula squamosa]|uniref:Uncharacterized protein n=1 Tax=Vespula squamosa TaxID=30214 RepID=A0ABD2C4Z6_VESSQ